MTEDEANKKWCPHTRFHATPSDDVYSNRLTGKPVATCLGAQCAAWRWLPLLADDAFKSAIIQAAKDIGDESSSKHKAAAHVIANRAQYGLPTKPFDGYCGLAGKS